MIKGAGKLAPVFTWGLMQNLDLVQHLLGDQQPNGVAGVTGNQLVRFERRLIKHNFKSREEGRDIHIEKDFIIKGGFEREVYPKDKIEYPKLWAAFEAGHGGVIVDGTALSEWQGVSRTKAAELIGMGIATVEQLARLSDGDLQKLGRGAKEIRDKAQHFLNDAKEFAPFAKIEAEKTRLEGELKLRDQMIADLSKRLDAVEGKKNKSRKAKTEDPT